MRRAARSPLPRVVLALALGALTSAGLTSPAQAGRGGLVVVAQADYRVLPDEGRVHVVVDAVATSYEPNTPDAQVYYSGTTFAVQPGVSNVTAFAGGNRIGARIVEQTEDFTAIEVTFARGVFYQQSYAYQVQFDMVDPGGEARRDLHITSSVVAFPVWAYGTEGEPGGSVSVQLPAGYNPVVQGSGVEVDRSGDGTRLSAEVDDPFEFFAYVSADRPGAFVGTTLTLDVGGTPANLLVRAWEDDPEWGSRIASIMTDGLPALQALIGLPYPVSGRLSLEEAAITRLGNYAGLYNAVTGVIRVRYDADAYVALHEAAHVWFNDRLWRDRWINEAWAEFYSVEAGRQLGLSGSTFELTDELLEARIPLNAWAGVGIEDPLVEDFAYAATYELAGLIAERAEIEGLRDVWLAAEDGHMAYQPLMADGPAAIGVPRTLEDWKRLLDLLEERTGEEFADLWAEWVVTRQQEPLLANRARARDDYAALVVIADAWELPVAIRHALGAWQFPDARELMDDAEEVLEDRDTIAQRADELGLPLPDSLQAAFEGDDGLDAAANEARAQLDALEALDAAAESAEGEPNPLEGVGLWGADPDAELQAARTAFEDGETEAAVDGALRTVALRQDAAEVGRERVTLAAAALLLLDGLGMAALSARRLRRSAPALRDAA